MSDFHRHDTYNPSTGLPMMGSVDTGGYMFGESFSDRFKLTSSFSGYDPMHQNVGGHFTSNGDHSSRHYVNIPQTQAGQIAVNVAAAVVFTAIIGFIILGTIGVF